MKYAVTAAQATTNNVLLAKGELGYVEEGPILKIGNGVDHWNDLDAIGGAGGTPLTQEEVEDFVGAMVTGNTETGLTAAYNDGTGKLDFTNGYTDESIQDLVGAMVSGNVESGITASYDDTAGKLDFDARPKFIIPFTITATDAAAGTDKLMNPTGRTLIIDKVAITKSTTVATTDNVLDVNIGGTTIYSTQANRPKIVIGATAQVISGSLGVPDGTASWADAALVTIDRDTMGTDLGVITGSIVVH